MATFNANFSEDQNFKASFQGDKNMNARFENTQIVPVGNYEGLPDKPSINGEVLVGDKPIESFGVETLTNTQIKQIFDRVFKKGD